MVVCCGTVERGGHGINMKKSHKIINWINFGIFHGYCMLSVGFKYDEIIKELNNLNKTDNCKY